MSAYLDTSVLVSLFVRDANSPTAFGIVANCPDAITSLWAMAEYSSALALRERKGHLAGSERAQAEKLFDAWMATRPAPVAVTADDLVETRRFLTRLKAPLRAPDALHLAMCRRVGADLASLDLAMGAAARELQIQLRTP